jgi:hypothetical protein
MDQGSINTNTPRTSGEFAGYHFVRPVIRAPESVPSLRLPNLVTTAMTAEDRDATELLSPLSPQYRQELLDQVAKDLMRTTEELRDVCATESPVTERDEVSRRDDDPDDDGREQQERGESIRLVLSSELAVLQDELQAVRYSYSIQTPTGATSSSTAPTGLTSRCSLDSDIGGVAPWELTPRMRESSCEIPGQTNGQTRADWARSPRASLSRQIMRLQRGIALLQQEIESGVEVSDARQMIAMTRELGILRATITAAFDQRVHRIEEQLGCITRSNTTEVAAVATQRSGASRRRHWASEPSSPTAALSPRSTILDPGYLQKVKLRKARWNSGVRFARQSLPEDQLSQSASRAIEQPNHQTITRGTQKTMSDSFLFDPPHRPRTTPASGEGGLPDDEPVGVSFSGVPVPRAHRLRPHTRRVPNRSKSSPDMSGRGAGGGAGAQACE